MTTKEKYQFVYSWYRNCMRMGDWFKPDADDLQDMATRYGKSIVDAARKSYKASHK
jgi:hypothetical protein